MKRLGRPLATLLVFALLFAGCSAKTTATSSPAAIETPTAAPAATAGEAIRLGLNLELTGVYAEYGLSCKEGIDMAVAELNAAGGIGGLPIELVVRDNASLIYNAGTATDELAEDGEVCAIIGPATTPLFSAQAQSAAKHRIKLISPSATSADLSKGEGYLLSTCYTDAEQAMAMAVFALDELKAKKIVVLRETDSDTAAALADEFSRAVEKAGGKLAGDIRFSAEQSSFDDQIKKLKKLEPDAVYLPSYAKAAGGMISSLREAGVVAPILGADGFDLARIIGEAGASALNEVYFTSHFSALYEEESTAAFVAAYYKANGKNPNTFAALGYDAVYFIAEALGKAATHDRAALAAAIDAATSFKGVTGNMVLANGAAHKDVFVVRLKNGVPEECVKAITVIG